MRISLGNMDIHCGDKIHLQFLISNHTISVDYENNKTLFASFKYTYSHQKKLLKTRVPFYFQSLGGCKDYYVLVRALCG